MVVNTQSQLCRILTVEYDVVGSALRFKINTLNNNKYFTQSTNQVRYMKLTWVRYAQFENDKTLFMKIDKLNQQMPNSATYEQPLKGMSDFIFNLRLTRIFICVLQN